MIEKVFVREKAMSKVDLEKLNDMSAFAIAIIYLGECVNGVYGVRNGLDELVITCGYADESELVRIK